MPATAIPIAAPERDDGLTPAGLHRRSEITFRRMVMAILNIGTTGAMLWALAVVLGAGGWTVTDVVMFVAAVFALPWTVLGFWNSMVGLWLLHGTKDGIAKVAPFEAAGRSKAPITVRTAIFMTLRNEDPERALIRLRTVKTSVDATGHGAHYDYFLLSDTNDPAVAAREEQLAAEWAAEVGDPSRIVYRRREKNTGYKAGNVRDFCERWGSRYELMLPLDADSLMSGETVVAFTRMMQAYPKIGILQSLVVGMPSKAAFARIFQFGMRQGMRAYTMGNVWWSGDCCPFWGHNAMVRIKPFFESCELPILKGKSALAGHIMSHDHVEATLMRRAGFESRVYPVEVESWEENPPTVLEHVKRELRWCLGNMQYNKLLATPGLKPMSRFQLLWAILMFAALPAWTLIIALLPLKAIEDQGLPFYPSSLAMWLYVVFFVMFLSPKLAGMLDILMVKGGTARYGGTARFLVSAVAELAFALVQGAVSALQSTIFMIGLVIGKSKIGWNGQARDVQSLSWTTAFSGLWPHLLFGLYVVGSLWVLSPTVLAWTLPLTAGYLLAIPFAVYTASPGLAAFLQRTGLCGIPEDFAPPPEVKAVLASDNAR